MLASGRGSNFESLARSFASGELPGAITLLVVDQRQEGIAMSLARPAALGQNE